MNAYEIPGLRYSLPAGGDVMRARFVSVDANSNGIQATADTKVIGASMNQTKAGEVLEIADGIVMVEVAAAIEAGKTVKSDADGKAIVDDTGAGFVAITGATALGQCVAVKI